MAAQLCISWSVKSCVSVLCGGEEAEEDQMVECEGNEPCKAGIKNAIANESIEKNVIWTDLLRKKN